MPTPLSTCVCSSYICYVVDLIACASNSFGNDCILSSFFSFILTSNKILYNFYDAVLSHGYESVFLAIHRFKLFLVSSIDVYMQMLSSSSWSYWLWLCTPHDVFTKRISLLSTSGGTTSRGQRTKGEASDLSVRTSSYLPSKEGSWRPEVITGLQSRKIIARVIEQAFLYRLLHVCTASR